MRASGNPAPAPSGAPGRVLVAGSLNVDLTLRVARLAAAGETVVVEDRHDRPGGKGLNQAVAAARAGAPVEMIGCLGDDESGALLRGALHDAGVGTSMVREVAGVPSGLAVVSVDAHGANSIEVVPGANASVTEEQMTAVPMTPSDVLVVQGEIPLAATAAFVEAGHRAGARTVVTLAPFFSPSEELLAASTVVVVNEAELFELVAHLSPGARVDGALVVEASRHVLSLGVEALVVTLGAAGMVALTAGGAEAEPARPVAAVDTTGAGDAVVGVLAAELVRGSPLRAGLRVAAAAASLAVQGHGAAAAMPSRVEIDAALG